MASISPSTLQFFSVPLFLIVFSLLLSTHNKAIAAFSLKHDPVTLTNKMGATIECEIITFAPDSNVVEISKLPDNTSLQLNTDVLSATSQEKIQTWYQRELLNQNLSIDSEEIIVSLEPVSDATRPKKEAYYNITLKNLTSFNFDAFEVYYYIPIEVPDVIEEFFKDAIPTVGIEGSFKVDGLQAEGEFVYESKRDSLPELEFVEALNEKSANGQTSLKYISSYKMSEPLGIVITINHQGKQVGEYRSFKQLANIEKLFLADRNLEDYQKRTLASAQRREAIISSQEKKQKQRAVAKLAKEDCTTLEDIQASILQVQGNHFNSTALLAKIREQYCIVVPTSTLARNDIYEFIDQDGKKYSGLKTPKISQSADIAIIPIEKPKHYLSVTDVEKNPLTPDLSVCIAGHHYPWPRFIPLENESPDSLYPFEDYAKTTAIEQNRIELSGTLNTVTHGSAIVSCLDGELIAVSQVAPNYLNHDRWEENPSFYKTSNFALRIDTIDDWEGSNDEQLNQDFQKLANYIQILVEGHSITKKMDSGEIPQPRDYMQADFKKILIEFEQEEATYKSRPDAISDLKKRIVAAINHYYALTAPEIKTTFFKTQLEELNFIKNWQIKRIEISTID